MSGVATTLTSVLAVFGVEIASLVVQGLLVPGALDLTGLAEGGDPTAD